jgi:glutathione synthase/RimK-type ligase-like ATP-grasp enzyme
MHVHIQALRELLGESRILYKEILGYEDALLVGSAAFIRSTTPFNDESSAALCLDKDAVLKLVSGTVLIPKTKSFIDPHGSHPDLCTAKSIDEIVEKSLDFLYPRVVKMNSGQSGRNVFVVGDEKEFRDSLGKIFDSGRRGYDYIALVQEHIDFSNEYRVAISAHEPIFAYAKGVYEVIEGKKKELLFKSAKKVIEKTGLSWGSVDFLDGRNGELYFLEVNTKPLYQGFVAENGNQMLKELFKKALNSKAWVVSQQTYIGSSLPVSSSRLLS